MAVVKLALCLLSVGVVCCKEWTSEEFPNPRTNPEKCRRPVGKISNICDPDGIITNVEARILDHLLVSIPNDTICPCSQWSCERPGKNQGYNMMVALVNKLKPLEGVKDDVQGRTGLARIFAFDLLKRKWTGLGNCNETIIVVFAKADGILLTLADSTARTSLTESKAAHIQQELAHFFGKDGNVGKGLHYLTVNYRRVLDGYPHTPVMYADLPSSGSVPMVSWLLAAMFALCTTLHLI